MNGQVLNDSGATIAVAGSDNALKSAKLLDIRVDEGLERLSTNLARSYLELGEQLRIMQQVKGYKLLGFERWEDYLSSKRTYGRTYLSYILRLAQAGNLSKYLDMGLGASQFIEYAKAARDPIEIPALIDETWELVRGRPIREVRSILRCRIRGLAEAPRPSSNVWPFRLKRTLMRKMRELPREQQPEFLDALREFLQTEGSRLGAGAAEPGGQELATMTIPATEA